MEALAAAMPPRYRLMVLMAAWCAQPFGELSELRRSDIDVKAAWFMFAGALSAPMAAARLRDPSPKLEAEREHSPSPDAAGEWTI